MHDPVEFKKRTLVLQHKKGECLEKELDVTQELPLTLLLGDIEVVTFLYNGQNPKELALGFLFSERILKRKEDVQSCVFNHRTFSVRVEPTDSIDVSDKLSGKSTITSGCGKGYSFYDMMDHIATGKIVIDSSLKITAEEIYQLNREVFRSSKLYHQTHGVHSAALCSSKQIVLFREDIGRHNAIDKIAGRAVMDNIGTDDKILFTTGRLTSEVIVKAGRLGCPVVISRSSATALALQLAEQINLTVIGGAKAGAFHIYKGADRVRSSVDCHNPE